MVEWTNNKHATLLYSGSRDGFSAAKFHKLCDNEGETITIVKSTTGYIFGGYRKGDTTAFRDFADPTGYMLHDWIFTLKNPTNQPRQFFYTPKYFKDIFYGAKFDNVKFGPCFGIDDIVIGDKSNTLMTSYFRFPSSFKDTSKIGYTIFTGSEYFQTSEIEVFLLQ